MAVIFSGFGGIRTHDQKIKSLLLYQLSYKPMRYTMTKRLNPPRGLQTELQTHEIHNDQKIKPALRVTN